MTKLIEMWAALSAYQPQADSAGHGESWAKMCTAKTYAAAADAAAYAAYAANGDASAFAAVYVENRAQKAIDSINRVLIKPPQHHNTKEN